MYIQLKILDYILHFPKQLPWCIQLIFCPLNCTFMYFGAGTDPFLIAKRHTASPGSYLASETVRTVGI